jgi:ABC-type glycerol-3-phosphate transport system permease component
MLKLRQNNLLSALFALLLLTGSMFAQKTVIIETVDEVPQEISESDGVPVIVKNLPNYEAVRDQAIFAPDAKKLAAAVGDHPIVSAINFTPGTEAAVATYDVGKLAIVEFTNPDMAIEMDGAIQAKLAELTAAGQPVPVYGKVGNYAVFVFDAKDTAVANQLISEVKYEKIVQWMGTDPYAFHRAERHYVETTSDVVLNTIRLAGIGLVITLFVGCGVGFAFYRMRSRQLTTTGAYSDSGMVTLNIENLSSQNSADRLLNSKNV